jgi:hypothetical protein
MVSFLLHMKLAGDGQSPCRQVRWAAAGGLWVQSDMAIFRDLQAPRLPPMLVRPLTKACIN